MGVMQSVYLDLSVRLGTTVMPIHQLLRMGRGAVIELDMAEDEDVTILANDFPVAKGAVVINGNKIGVEITELLNRPVEMR